jgi:hypothetical protein
MYVNPWIYRGEIFDEKLVDKYDSFVYIITYDDKKYLGKKTFWFMRKKPGAKRRSRMPSDWKTYYGSSEVMKKLVKENLPDLFRREILHLCITKGESTYYETREQFCRDVLVDPSYINDNILGKFFTERVKKWIMDQTTLLT